MKDEKNEESIEFILQHWNLISEQKKKILELLGITPNKPNCANGYQKHDTYKNFSYES